jgi:predicted lipid carrier protein YhbT
LPRDSLAPLARRTFLIIVSDTGSRAAFTFVNGGFKPPFNFHSYPDITFTATLSVFLRPLVREEDPDTLFFNQALSVEGDSEPGLMVKNMLDAVGLPKLA